MIRTNIYSITTLIEYIPLQQGLRQPAANIGIAAITH